MEINNCVKCGGEGELGYLNFVEGTAPIAFDVQCLKCGKSYGDYATEESAITGWNHLNPVPKTEASESDSDGLKHKYLMDYIPDKQVFKAVMFARHMIRNGEIPALAIGSAAKHFKVDKSHVAHYVGQVAGRVKSGREYRREYFKQQLKRS